MNLPPKKFKLWLASIGNWHFPSSNPNQNIGLHGDGDDVKILESVEMCFSLKISDLEAQQISNVGDLYDLVFTRRQSAGVNVSWGEFLEALKPHSRLPVEEIKRETEFYRHIQRWKL
ncbi:MAG: hypothetical protein O9342_02650 [Beijerinckiaceae bacterium]|nr:hypothetical protein [Beijerinckiaceae bacterium]